MRRILLVGTALVLLPALSAIGSVAAVMDGSNRNPDPTVPPQCYTVTDGKYNPCWVCHTVANARNSIDDLRLQRKYSFASGLKINHWNNLFLDRTKPVAQISDAEILRYVRQDNYSSFLTMRKSVARPEQPVPDLNLSQGFDAQGFAKDGSGWRAFRYKPFPGAFWPTNGSTDDVFIRLPTKFREDETGRPSQAVYRKNLAILETMVSELNSVTSRRPHHYAGAAARVPAIEFDYPIGTEFLHTVRYLDPRDPNFMAKRMKEVRYAVKKYRLDPIIMKYRYGKEAAEEKSQNITKPDSPLEKGINNGFGWHYIAFIEGSDGKLRTQTRVEHEFCLGCHSGIGVTVDQSFSFPRKVPGARGWGYQDLRGMPDAPQNGSVIPEIALYFARAGGGDEFRSNQEILANFFRDGALDVQRLCRAYAATGDIRSLVLPSARRALELDKAYLVIVRQQSFLAGRDATLEISDNVHREVRRESTGLEITNKVYADGRLWLNWKASSHPDWCATIGEGSVSPSTSDGVRFAPP
jgi:hypothetical protein